ncbi:MAG: hypothetical protein ABEJ31_05475 [Haloarculaceae archaeon]
MAEHARSHESAREPDDQFGSFETQYGEFIVYDRDEPSAWIQSDVALDVEE